MLIIEKEDCHMADGLGVARFTANNVYIEIEGRHFIATSISGDAYVDVDGEYSYTPATMYDSNGDPGDPEEEDCEVDDVQLAGDIEIDDYDLYQNMDDYPNEPEMNNDELEEFINKHNEEIIDVICDNIDSSDCIFDEDDTEEILANNYKEGE